MSVAEYGGWSLEVKMASRCEKLQKLAIKGLGDLKVRYVADIWNDHQFGARNRAGDVFGQLRKVLAVSLSSQNEGLGLDVRPVIDDRVEIDDLLVDGAHHG